VSRHTFSYNRTKGTQRKEGERGGDTKKNSNRNKKEIKIKSTEVSEGNFGGEKNRQTRNGDQPKAGIWVHNEFQI